MNRYSTNYKIDSHQIDEIVTVSADEWKKYYDVFNWQETGKIETELWLKDTSMFINMDTGSCLIVEKDVRNMNVKAFIVPKFHGISAMTYRPPIEMTADDRMSDKISDFLILDEKGKNKSTGNIFIVMVPEVKDTYGQDKDVAFRPLFNILKGEHGTVKNYSFGYSEDFVRAFGNRPVPIYD